MKVVIAEKLKYYLTFKNSTNLAKFKSLKNLLKFKISKKFSLLTFYAILDFTQFKQVF